MGKFRYLAVLLVMLLVSSHAMAEKRVALVIGNSDYSHKSLPSLNNAKKDATDMARKLKRLGFEVILKTGSRFFRAQSRPRGF